MDKLEMRHTLLAAKARKQMSWDEIASAVGMSPVWVASACYGMNSASADVAHKLCDVLEVDGDVATALTAFPTKAWDEAIPRTPSSTACTKWSAFTVKPSRMSCRRSLATAS